MIRIIFLDSLGPLAVTCDYYGDPVSWTVTRELQGRDA